MPILDWSRKWNLEKNKTEGSYDLFNGTMQKMFGAHFLFPGKKYL